jgi:hypothetical protein
MNLLVCVIYIERKRERESMGEKRNAYKVLVGKSERKRPLGKIRRRWEDNTKIGLREIGKGSMLWIHLAQDRVQ